MFWKNFGTVSIGNVPPLAANCNTNNKFELSIKDSGDIEPEENKKTQYLH